MLTVAGSCLDVLRRIPGAAYCVGVTVYLGWIAVFALGFRQPLPGTKEGVALQNPRGKRRALPRRSAAAVARCIAAATLTALASIMAFVAFTAEDPDDRCLAEPAGALSVDRSGWALQSLVQEPYNGTYGPEPAQPRPSELLTRARLAMKFRSGKEHVQSALEACAWWSAPNSEGPASDEDLHSQLVCFRGLVESGFGAAQQAPAVLVHSRQIFDAVRSSSSAPAAL
eukprot:CAMPEP_0179025028 /NCGR_PEP_ID=MMETSP0796-20121207/7764_1 /TAXON_ID=73915 /ORGANISM="Pyrodinium bahamense, Strain pbaha01" /LENGTH=226 /DNA_ID=CAMNT_0020721017 /DNA_START=93 /DNA_END=770 /DNA_ORIENTATION=+